MVDGLGGDDQAGGDLRVGAPGTDEVEDFCFAAVRPWGCSRVAAWWPAGIERMPSWRIVRRMMLAVAAAARSWQISRARRKAVSWAESKAESSKASTVS
jgi:hypothetical protein